MPKNLFRCACFSQKIHELSHLDYGHRGLREVPADIFNHERTLIELDLNNNNIEQLSKELFCCREIRKLNLSDNDLKEIPMPIGSLVNLQELNVCKNNIMDVSDNISQCRQLALFDASVNPLGKLPDGFTKLLHLNELLLNDCLLNYLPGNIGRLSNLRILELRDNHLKTLPNSMGRLTQLERLDVGSNELTELPTSFGDMSSLLEFWCAQNELTTLPASMGRLRQLMFLDCGHNRLESLPEQLGDCSHLSDLHLSHNRLTQLPDSLGRLNSLTTLKLECNCLRELPYSIGGMVSLSEMALSSNQLESLTPSIGLLRNLRTLHIDNNRISEIPPELGSCTGLSVLSLRSNHLTVIPDELGRISRLRVMNLSNNRLRYLPYTFIKLRELQALWLSDNQSQPMVQLQSDRDLDTGQRCLVSYLLPQMTQDPAGDVLEAPDAWEFSAAARARVIQFESESEHEGRRRLPKDAPDRHHARVLALRSHGLPANEQSALLAAANQKSPSPGPRQIHYLQQDETLRTPTEPLSRSTQPSPSNWSRKGIAWAPSTREDRSEIEFIAALDLSSRTTTPVPQHTPTAYRRRFSEGAVLPRGRVPAQPNASPIITGRRQHGPTPISYTPAGDAPRNMQPQYNGERQRPRQTGYESDSAAASRPRQPWRRSNILALAQNGDLDTALNSSYRKSQGRGPEGNPSQSQQGRMNPNYGRQGMVRESGYSSDAGGLLLAAAATRGKGMPAGRRPQPGAGPARMSPPGVVVPTIRQPTPPTPTNPVRASPQAANQNRPGEHVSISSDSGYSPIPRLKPPGTAHSVSECSDNFPLPPIRSPPPPPVDPSDDLHQSSRSPSTTSGVGSGPPPGEEVSDTTWPVTSRRTMEMNVTVIRNPGLGFSIVGGLGSPGNPYRTNDPGIFVTKVSYPGPASLLAPGDKILQVNGTDFSNIQHTDAVKCLKATGRDVQLTVERKVLERCTDI